MSAHLFGSSRIKQLFPDFREPNDADYYFVEGGNPEIGNIPKPYELYYLPNAPNRAMTADEIYTLKVSHAIYNIQWRKHMSDIRFLQMKGCKVIPEFLEELREFWSKIHHDQKYSRFDFTAKENIFDDKLGRKQPHDELHLMFSDELDFPKFSDGEIPNENKWNKLSHELKKKICVEEAYVIALERYLNDFTYQRGYVAAQQLLITRLHPVFIADWAIQNWNEIYKAEINFYERYRKNKVQ